MFRPTPSLHPQLGRPVGEDGNLVFSPTHVASLLSEEAIKGQRYLNNSGFTDTGRNSIPLHPDNQFPDYHVFPNSAPQQEPRFLTEQEYRNNGLRQGRPLLLGDGASHPWERNVLDQELKQLLRNPAPASADSSVQQREVVPNDPNFPSEKEYRTYGLRGPHQMPNPDASLPRLINPEIVRDPAETVCDPYDESTTSVVNRYLSIPTYPRREPPYIHDSNQTVSLRVHGKRPFASYSLGEQSDSGQRLYSPNSHEPSGQHKMSAPVSQRYSFSGPASSQQR